MSEPPLTDRELRTLRELLSEYERHQVVRVYLAQAKRAFRTWIVIVVALLALILQAVGHH